MSPCDLFFYHLECLFIFISNVLMYLPSAELKHKDVVEIQEMIWAKQRNKTAGIIGRELWRIQVGCSINLEYKTEFESRQFHISI